MIRPYRPEDDPEPIPRTRRPADDPVFVRGHRAGRYGPKDADVVSGLILAFIALSVGVALYYLYLG